MSRQPSPYTPQAKLNRASPVASDVRLGDITNDLIVNLNALRADMKTLQAKLNADAGVTDTNYGAVDTAVAITDLSLRQVLRRDPFRDSSAPKLVVMRVWEPIQFQAVPASECLILAVDFQVDAGGPWAQQDKGSYLSYSFDWTDWLVPGDSISTSVWTADVALSLNTQTLSGAVTTVWVQGGLPAKWYAVTNSVTSADGRIEERTFRLLITDDSSATVDAGGTALFPNRDIAVAALRRDQLAIAAANHFPGVTLDDDFLFDKLRAAEADAQRRLKVFFQPTVILPDDAPQAEIDALVTSSTPYFQEAPYDYDNFFFQGDRWGYLTAKQKPIISVQSMTFDYPSPATEIFEIPADWIRLDKKYGVVRLVPGTQTFTAPLSVFMLQALGGGYVVPFMIHLRYTAGLANAARDYPDLVDVVKKMAVLLLIEDGFLPQSGSISADGLSESMGIDVQKYRDSIDAKLFGGKGSNGGLYTALNGIMVGMMGTFA